ncbi:hypothetical protein HU200_000642 [Digitaria exilis]|uniref:Uncharacterized protein n=1 Tax=Digitaria exilis TaxID=1010633 RepID=A0A835G183_9POAL|nr:hypothetical protein HU200_000642 [Digitaria exilis]
MAKAAGGLPIRSPAALAQGGSHHAVAGRPEHVSIHGDMVGLYPWGDGTGVELPATTGTFLRARPRRSSTLAHSRCYAPGFTFSDTPERPAATEVFTISRDQVVALRRLCGGASAFSSVSALVWRCTIGARRLPPDAEARLSFPAQRPTKGDVAGS